MFRCLLGATRSCHCVLVRLNPEDLGLRPSLPLGTLLLDTELMGDRGGGLSPPLLWAEERVTGWLNTMASGRPFWTAPVGAEGPTKKGCASMCVFSVLLRPFRVAGKKWPAKKSLWGQEKSVLTKSPRRGMRHGCKVYHDDLFYKSTYLCGMKDEAGRRSAKRRFVRDHDH